MMLERNNAQKELDRLKKSYERERATLQSQIDELQKLSSPRYYAHNADKVQQQFSTLPQAAPSITTGLSGKSVSTEENKALQDENEKLAIKLAEAEEKVFNLTTEYELSQAQFNRQLQDMQLKLAKYSTPESFKNLEDQLSKEKKRSQELEEALDMKSSHGRKLIIGTQAVFQRIS